MDFMNGKMFSWVGALSSHGMQPCLHYVTMKSCCYCLESFYTCCWCCYKYCILVNQTGIRLEMMMNMFPVKMTNMMLPRTWSVLPCVSLFHLICILDHVHWIFLTSVSPTSTSKCNVKSHLFVNDYYIPS